MCVTVKVGVLGTKQSKKITVTRFKSLMLNSPELCGQNMFITSDMCDKNSSDGRSIDSLHQDQQQHSCDGNQS